MSKRIVLKLTAVLILFCLEIQARDIESVGNNSDVNSVLKLGITPGGIEYEYLTSNSTSINLVVYYSYKGLADSDFYDFQISPEFRFYLSKNKNRAEGLYFGSYLFYKDYIVARDTESNGVYAYSRDDVKTAGVGLKPGYQHKLTEWLSLDFGMGLGYNLYRDVTHKTGNEIINEPTHHLNFTGGLAVGIRF